VSFVKIGPQTVILHLAPYVNFMFILSKFWLKVGIGNPVIASSDVLVD